MIDEMTFHMEPMSSEVGVNEKDKRLLGAKVIQLGRLNDARGDMLYVDEETLTQIVKLGNQPNKGVRVRFNHPQPGEDMSRKHLGRAKNFRVDGDSVRADIWLAASSFSELARNSGGYVLQLVGEDPEALGLSVHTALDIVAMRESASEDDIMPLRFKSLLAVDVVDMPAATRGGMFRNEESVMQIDEELKAGEASGPGKPVAEEVKPVEEPKPEVADKVAEKVEAVVEEEKMSEEPPAEAVELAKEKEELDLLAQAQPFIEMFGEADGASMFLRGADLDGEVRKAYSKSRETILELKAEVEDLRAKLSSVEGVVESFEEVQTEISGGLSASQAGGDNELSLREKKIEEARKCGLSGGAASFVALTSK